MPPIVVPVESRAFEGIMPKPTSPLLEGLELFLPNAGAAYAKADEKASVWMIVVSMAGTKERGRAGAVIQNERLGEDERLCSRALTRAAMVAAA